MYLRARSALVHEPWSNSVPERQYFNLMTRVEEDAKDVSRPLFNLTRLRFARSCGMTWCSMHRFYFFSLKLMEWKWNATCYMGCPNLCTKRRQIAGEFWVTVSNLPLKMQSLFKSTEGWCKFVSKSGSGCISWGYFSFSLALYDLGACFSLPWSIHIYCKAKYFLWLCNGNSLQYNPPLLSLFHYRPLLSWDRIIQYLFIAHFLSHSRKYTHLIAESHKLHTPSPFLYLLLKFLSLESLDLSLLEAI